MAKTSTQPTAADAPVGADSPRLSITDFCMRLSETITNPELIAAFAHVQQKTGHVSDTAAGFRARYDEFINLPV